MLELRYQDMRMQKGVQWNDPSVAYERSHFRYTMNTFLCLVLARWK